MFQTKSRIVSCRWASRAFILDVASSFFPLREVWKMETHIGSYFLFAFRENSQIKEEAKRVLLAPPTIEAKNSRPGKKVRIGLFDIRFHKCFLSPQERRKQCKKNLRNGKETAEKTDSNSAGTTVLAGSAALRLCGLCQKNSEKAVLRQSSE